MYAVGRGPMRRFVSELLLTFDPDLLGGHAPAAPSAASATATRTAGSSGRSTGWTPITGEEGWTRYGCKCLSFKGFV